MNNVAKIISAMREKPDTLEAVATELSRFMVGPWVDEPANHAGEQRRRYLLRPDLWADFEVSARHYSPGAEAGWFVRWSPYEGPEVHEDGKGGDIEAAMAGADDYLRQMKFILLQS